MDQIIIKSDPADDSPTSTPFLSTPAAQVVMHSVSPILTPRLPRPDYHVPMALPDIKQSITQQGSQDSPDPVKVHQIILAGETVCCMPDVNKVLRQIYKVLSQANYYLSKFGITSRRFSGTHLLRLKVSNILNHDAKVCSFISRVEAERIFDSFDNGINRDKHIIWVKAICIDDSPIDVSDNRIVQVQSSPSQPEPPVDRLPAHSEAEVQPFLLDQQEIVCVPDLVRAAARINQGATVNYYIQKLDIPCNKFAHGLQLDRLRTLGIVKRSAVHCSYVSRSDAERVLEVYHLWGENATNKVAFLPPIPLPDYDIRQNWMSPNCNSPKTSVPAGSLDDSSNCSSGEIDDSIEQARTPAEPPGEPPRVNIYIVDNKEVIATPDLHRVVHYIQGSTVQVNYYLSKMMVKKRRFSFAQLKELRNHQGLQGNATYCTYISKEDAFRVLEIYHQTTNPRLSDVVWVGPINLDHEPYTTIQGSQSQDQSSNGASGVLRVQTLLIGSELVVCVPDVAKIVEYLGEQTTSLDYHFKKLGIQKRRFEYPQLHQLRNHQVIRRPTLCTYITRGDLEKLLHMYMTDKNRNLVASIAWLTPVHLPPHINNGTESSASNGVDEDPNQSAGGENGHDTLDAGSKGSALRPDLDKKTARFSGHISPSIAAERIKQANPDIDMPIVIPNGDFDASQLIVDQGYDVDVDPQPFPKKARMCVDSRSSPDEVELLRKDLYRKETELRTMFEFYKQDLERNKESSVQLMEEMQKLKSANESLVSANARLKEEVAELEKERAGLLKELEPFRATVTRGNPLLSSDTSE